VTARPMFVLYLVVVVGGLLYFIALGLMHG